MNVKRKDWMEKLTIHERIISLEYAVWLNMKRMKKKGAK